MPEGIRYSKVLSGNHLGQLANVHELPVIQPSFDDEHLKNIIQYFSLDPGEMEKELHQYSAKLLCDGKEDEAWQLLLAID